MGRNRLLVVLVGRVQTERAFPEKRKGEKSQFLSSQNESDATRVERRSKRELTSSSELGLRSSRDHVTVRANGSLGKIKRRRAEALEDEGKSPIS